MNMQPMIVASELMGYAIINTGRYSGHLGRPGTRVYHAIQITSFVATRVQRVKACKWL